MYITHNSFNCYVNIAWHDQINDDDGLNGWVWIIVIELLFST